MERRTKVEDELNLCGVKMANLVKALEKVQSQASDLVVFALQWRDLEDHLMSVKGNVEKRFVELQKRSFEIDERAKVVEAGEVKVDGFMREVEEKEEELSGLRMLVERHRVEVSEEVELLRKAQNLKRELIEESEGKRRDLNLVQEKVVECGEMLETRAFELTKTQVQLELKGGLLAQMETDLERYRLEMCSAQTRRRELDEEIKRKTRDLTLVQGKVVECGKLLETRSLELKRTQGELDLKVEQLEHVKIDFGRHQCKLTAEMEHLERIQTRNRELEEDIERKRKDLAEVLDKTAECGKLLETRSLELVCKEKELQVLNNEIRETCQKMELKAKELEDIERLINERSGHSESIKLLIEEHTEELAFKEKRHDEITESTRKLALEISFKEKTLTERNKLVEEVEKKIQDLSNSNEELIRQVKVRQEQVSSINEEIRECTCELEAKRKDRDKVQSSITDLTVELKSVKKKIQESLEELQPTEEQHVKLKASLMEHEKGLELKEKELIAREEKINEQDQKLQLTKQELAKWVEDCEMKAKQLSNFCQESNPDQSRKRGRYDDKSLSKSTDEGSDGAIKTLDHVLTSCTTGQENTYNFGNQRSPDKFQIDQIWALYSYSDKGMPRKYAQIKRIDTSPEFKLHVAPLVLYRPPPNLTTHPVCCGRFKLKIGKAEVLAPSSFSHKVKAVKSSINRFEIYPGKGEIWALYKNRNITDCAETGEEVEIVEIVETNEQSIQAMLLTAKVFNKLLYGRCLESKTGVVDIPKTEVNRFSHQIPAFRRDRRVARSGDCEWWELDPKAVLDLNSKKP